MSDSRSNKDLTPEAVLMVEIVEGRSLVEYTGENVQRFAKITLALPKFVPAAKRLLTTTVIYDKLQNHSFHPFESNVDIETRYSIINFHILLFYRNSNYRFMVDKHILGCCWIEVPAKKWFARSLLHSQPFPVTSRCQLEVDVAWDEFVAHAPEGDWAPVARFRIHSLDIECAGRKGIFPEPNVDPVIQIANVVQLHGESHTFLRNIFTLKSCAPIGHAEVRDFDTEEEMLEAWAQFVRDLDPDIFTGYNINNFDLPYLLDRAKHLKLKQFDQLGRILNVK